MDLMPLHMAMRFASERPLDEHGVALANRRNRIIAESAKNIGLPRKADIMAEARRLLAVGIADMPPDPDDVALLLDAIAFRIGATSRAEAWRHIGINPNRGRGLLARSSDSVDWPIWFTLRTAALNSATDII